MRSFPSNIPPCLLSLADRVFEGGGEKLCYSAPGRHCSYNPTVSISERKHLDQTKQAVLSVYFSSFTIIRTYHEQSCTSIISIMDETLKFYQTIGKQFIMYY